MPTVFSDVAVCMSDKLPGKLRRTGLGSVDRYLTHTVEAEVALVRFCDMMPSW